MEADGFIQCVSFAPQDANIYFYGTSRNNFGIKDRRQPLPTVFKNNTMVNAISVFQDGLNLMTGDAEGLLKTWDIRAGKVIDTQNDTSGSPISCISTCNVADEEARLFATNSYDNGIKTNSHTYL